ncbi:MAG: glycosyltransferase family 39 protein [Candidatus Sumerlaeaceae bacterium]
MRWRTLLVVMLGLVVLFGAFIRVNSARKWKELDGDENLFALTAREFAQNTRLYYPVKYEFRPEVPYKVFASPATQHPPLFPLLGGLVAKALGTLNTFACLKGLACLAGVVAMLLVWRLSRRLGGEIAGLVGLSLCALFLTMIFYSAKASVYMLLACTNLGILSVAEYLPVLTRRQSALLGALAAFGLLLHSCMFATVAAVFVVLVITWKHWRTLHLPILGAAFAAVLLPYLAWNYYHLKSPFASYSTTYFLMINRLTTPGIVDGNLVYLRVHKPLNMILPEMAKSTLNASVLFSFHVARNVGPAALVLAGVGLWWLWRRKRLVCYSVVLIILFQVGISSMVGIYRARFSVPVLPVLFVLAGVGTGALVSGRWWWRIIAAMLAAAGVLQYLMVLHLDHDHFYTEASSGTQAVYQKMRKLSAKMAAELQPGVILGAAKLLDGGLETHYWLGWPYVHGREMYGPQWTPMLANDFHAKYVWCDRHNGRKVARWLPNYRSIMMNEHFVIFARRDDQATTASR